MENTDISSSTSFGHLQHWFGLSPFTTKPCTSANPSVKSAQENSSESQCLKSKRLPAIRTDGTFYPEWPQRRSHKVQFWLKEFHSSHRRLFWLCFPADSSLRSRSSSRTPNWSNSWGTTSGAAPSAAARRSTRDLIRYRSTNTPTNTTAAQRSHNYSQRSHLFLSNSFSYFQERATSRRDLQSSTSICQKSEESGGSGRGRSWRHFTVTLEFEAGPLRE